MLRPSHKKNIEPGDCSRGSDSASRQTGPDHITAYSTTVTAVRAIALPLTRNRYRTS